MGLGFEDVKVKSWDTCKSKGRKKKKKNSEKEDLDDEAMVEETGCWVKLRFIGSCISSRSKVDSSVSGTSTHYDSKSANDTSRDQPTAPVVSSTTTSNAESSSSTSKLEDELKVASRLRKFTFNDLKLATRNFRPESLLGEGGFGCVFKGWIEENGTAPVKPGTGLTVAVKTLNHDGLQGHKEWLLSRVENFVPDADTFCRHLTSRSDVYSFGVVLLEMLTGRRSMDKNRPNGEHNLVEWARPHLGERRRFYRLIDPRLEGHFSIKGAQKAAQLAAHCLSRDPKARPLMSEVVEALKPLPNLKDMASSSYYFQTMQAERVGSSPNTRNGIRSQGGALSRNGQRSLSIPNGSYASPYHHQFPYQSPKPKGKP
ncbi:hypothetical protein CCACVL1_07422 [Corchorus capsularis]|uniref:Protein kinase domain-containing protein n=1 Tax=Corchorus capsularis TaxID=210143 RepID=A0A1R3J6A1_COCAP|nr:hypothetical protein CCACVL1_07422 [Corchorus capsularis]